MTPKYSRIKTQDADRLHAEYDRLVQGELYILFFLESKIVCVRSKISVQIIFPCL
jgi:hypothetical protein